MRYLKALAVILTTAALLCGCGCAPSPSPSPSQTPAPTSTPTPTPSVEYRGIDVSFYQGNIDFDEVKADGIEAVYIRAGEGLDITDSRFEANYQKASAAGLKLGFYFFVTAENTAQAATQAQRFAQLIEGKSYVLRPAMDFETFDGLNTAEINAIGLAFLQELESLTGITPVLYTDAYSAESLWYQELSAYPLWVADYGPGENDPPKTGIWSTWAGYQYADDGSISGIDAAVDLDIFRDGVLVS